MSYNAITYIFQRAYHFYDLVATVVKVPSMLLFHPTLKFQFLDSQLQEFAPKHEDTYKWLAYDTKYESGHAQQMPYMH